MTTEDLKKLKELKKTIRIASIAYLKSKNLIKADDMMDMENEDEMCPGCESLKAEQDHFYYLLQNIGSYLNNLESMFYTYVSNHQNGHLPPIVGAEKMAGALKSLGVDKDYEVRKPVIYASEIEDKNDTISISITSKK